MSVGGWVSVGGIVEGWVKLEWVSVDGWVDEWVWMGGLVNGWVGW